MLYWAKRAQEILLSTGDTQLQSSFAPHVLLYCTWWLGDLAKAELILNTLKPRMTSSDIVPIANITWLANAAAFYWMTAASEDCVNAAERGLALADKHGIHIWDMFLCSQGTFGKMFARGEPDSADVFLNRMASLLIPSRSLDSSFYFYLKAAKHFFVNELQQAEECARQGAFHCEQSGWLWGASHMKMTLGRMLFHRGKHVEGLTMVRESRAEDATNVPACHLNTQEYLSYLAEAEFALVLGDEAGCANALRQSLAVAQRHGFLNHTWWQPLLMSRLYAIALTHDIEPEYVRRIITLRALTPPADAPVPDTWPYPVKLHTLGRFTVTRDDQPLSRSPSHQKPLELLQALIALGGREVDEERLAELFWPEAEGDVAIQNLKINVHRLRKLLPEDALVWTEGKLTLDAHRVWVDLWALERELNRLDQATPAKAVALAQRIFRLYRGAFLPENTAPWALAARERIHNKTLRLVTRAAETLLSTGPVAAVPLYDQAIELDPLRESLYQGLMRCHRALHRPAEVEHVYRRCRDVLKRELGVEPSGETETLIKSLRAK
jgi:DNA-binding SARP family transcriptional activator